MRTETHSTLPSHEFDTVDHIAEVVGRRAVFTTPDGVRMVGVVEVGNKMSCGMPRIRFDDGRWGQGGYELELVVED